MKRRLLLAALGAVAVGCSSKSSERPPSWVAPTVLPPDGLLKAPGTVVNASSAPFEAAGPTAAPILAPVALPEAPSAPLEAAGTMEPLIAAPVPPPLGVLATVAFDPPDRSGISEVLAVKVRVEVRGSAGPHRLSAEFTAPAGLAYERKATPIEGSAFSTQVVEFILPVAATMIDTQKLAGVWTVHLFHDGEQLAAPTFELTP